MTKVIKLSELYRPKKYWQFTKVPMLRLSGKWLEQAGFQAKKTVYVEVQDGKMIITAID
jgi:hypothetical protein